MNKTKTKSKGILKGVALGFAFVMCSAFFPAHAIASAIDYIGNDAKINANRIQVDGQNNSVSVKKGETVTIPEGEYVYKKADGQQGTHTIGGAVGSDNITSSTVEVFYTATNDKVSVIGNTFVADRVGRYTIVYTVVQNGTSYSYEMIVNSTASEATFEFEQNSKNIIPTVYDIALADSKDIVLPLPTVNDKDGEEILTASDSDYYTLNKDSFIAPVDDDKNAFVEITLSNAGSSVSIKEREVEGKKEYYISGEDLANQNGREFKVYYSYYQISDNGNVFVSSTSKSFTVKNNYYYTTSDKEEIGYSLETNWSTSTSSLSAVVGVEKELPKITATTKSTNSPSSETVEVYYEVKVYKRDTNEDVTATVITEDGKFKAKEEGSYKFVYSVKDFYGNTAAESTTTFYIYNVKDSLQASVYIYDAGNPNAYDAEKNTYQSASYMLKSQTVNRNIVMYAVGGTDNMVSQDELSLRREIRDNSGVKKYVIDEKEYAGYNLIFAPAKASGVGDSTTVYHQIVIDNYQIYRQMLLEGKDISSESDIKNFLKEHKYLLVTTEFNKDIEGNEIVEGLTETDENAITKMIRADVDGEVGYAYVAPQNKNNATFTDQSYSFYYYAGDNINTDGQTFATVKVTSDFTDETIPTINFSSDLQVAYLPTDTFEFKVATASDSVDSKIETVTAYRYLDSLKNAIASNQTTSKLEYVVKNAKDTSKWYSSVGVVSSEGWYKDDSKSTYSVDLANKPAEAKYVEILCYAIDDYGNAGFFNKIIKIADAQDNDMPEIYKIVNAPNGEEYQASSIINLPTLYFADSNPNYMHASVSVYKLSRDDGGNVVNKVSMKSSNMSTEYSTTTDSFKVNAGSFHASTAGEYQVAVTVSDSGNHSVTTFFTYKVVGTSQSIDPEITNITSSKIDLKAGQAYHLVPPTLSIIEDEQYGYVGIDENDDSYTATNYTTTVISATGDYELDQYYFTGNEEGVYKLQYKVFLLKYSKSILVDSSAKENGYLYFENEKLKFMYNDTEYFVSIDRENENVLKANTNLQGIGDDIGEEGLASLSQYVTVYTPTSEVQTFNVGGVEMDITLDKNAYTESYDQLGTEIEIIKPNNIVYNGTGYQTNNAESKVTITKTFGGVTTTLAELNFEEWGDALDTTTSVRDDFRVENGKVYLSLNDNGKYTIKYSIQAQDKNGSNVGSASTLEYVIKNGDIEGPSLELKKNLIETKYSVGDTLTLNMSGITVDDNFTTNKDEILKTMKVSIKNTDLDESAITLTNQAGEDEEGVYIYSHKLESAGNYTLTITVEDEAGNITTQTMSFEVTSDSSTPVDVKEVMGGVLIGLSVAILAGVVIYFIVSKVKLDKKEKSYKSDKEGK